MGGRRGRRGCEVSSIVVEWGLKIGPPGRRLKISAENLGAVSNACARRTSSQVPRYRNNYSFPTQDTVGAPLDGDRSCVQMGMIIWISAASIAWSERSFQWLDQFGRLLTDLFTTLHDRQCDVLPVPGGAVDTITSSGREVSSSAISAKVRRPPTRVAASMPVATCRSHTGP